MSEKWLAASITFIVSFIFLTGYTYLDGYYDFYDISVGELNLDIQNILVYSAPVYMSIIFEHYFLLGLSIFSLTVIFSIILLFSNFSSKLPTAIVLSIVGFFFICLLLAHSFGLKRAAADLSSLNKMHVVGSDIPIGFTELLDLDPTAQLFHLVTTSSTVYGIIRYNRGGDRWVVRLPATFKLTTQVYQDGGPLS